MQQGLENDKDAVFKKYYTTIFPYNEIFRVLNINENKELAFGKDSGTFIRYETFCNANDFYRRICQVIPYRIDVGSTFKNRPTKYDQNILVSRQLVFDIDLTDYDRKCCKEKKICAKCYDLIKCAIEVLSHILKKQFGFDQFGFVFSGRRGVHCWVFGEDDLDAQVRTNIFKYFDIVISRNFLESEYERILQKYAGNTEKIEDLLKWFPKIDKQVIVQSTHLIKMPFSIHPETMNVSVPLDPSNIKEFEELPTVYSFLDGKENIDEYVKIMNKWVE